MASTKPSRQPKPKPPPAPPVMSDDAVMADINRRHTWAKTWRMVLPGVVLGLLLLCAYPVTTALAGKQTVLNISIGITLSATITIAGVAAALWGNHHRTRADRLANRNKQLSRDVRELQGRLREHGLSDEVTRS